MKHLLPCLLGILILPASSLIADDIFSDDFSDGNYEGWYSSSTLGGIAIESGGLKVSAGRSVQARFTPTELSLGDSISLKFQISLSTIADTSSGFRFGLFDSHGTPLNSNENTLFLPYDGIIVATNPSGQSGTASFRARNPNLSVTGSGALMTTTKDVYSIIAPTGAYGSGLLADTGYDVDLTFLKTEFGLSLSFSISSGEATLQSLNIVFDEALDYNFDTLGISGVTDMGDFRLDNVRIVVVPEPSTSFLAIGGLFAMSAAFYRRRAK